MAAAVAPLTCTPANPFLAMTLRLMLNMAGPPAPPTAFKPLLLLLLISLSVTSTVTGPLVVSIFIPPPLLPVIVT